MGLGHLPSARPALARKPAISAWGRPGVPGGRSHGGDRILRAAVARDDAVAFAGLAGARFPLRPRRRFTITVLVALSIGLAVTFVIAIPLVWFTFLVAGPAGPDGTLTRRRACSASTSGRHTPACPGHLVAPPSTTNHHRQPMEGDRLSVARTADPGGHGPGDPGALVRRPRVGRTSGLRDPPSGSFRRSRCASRAFGTGSSHRGGLGILISPSGSPGDAGARGARSKACWVAARSPRTVKPCSAGR